MTGDVNLTRPWETLDAICLDSLETRLSEQTAEGDAQHGSAHPHHREDAVATGHGPVGGANPGLVA